MSNDISVPKLKGECKQCGICCKAIMIQYSPEEINEIAEYSSEGSDAKFIKENWELITKEEALEINSYLEEWFKLPHNKQFHQYKCKKLDYTTNKCTIRDTRPRVCEGFPWYDKDPVRNEPLYSPDCGYQIDIKEEVTPCKDTPSK